MPRQFDPFRDRLSRDIRNDLSESLLTCLRDGLSATARAVAERYLTGRLEPCHRDYIANRLERYDRFLALVQGESDPLRQGFILWELGLYFEVHEILEQAWLRAEGTEKELLQALIRAAGVQIKRECGFEAAAAKMAAKALPVLAAHRQRLAAHIDPAPFLALLQPEP